MGLYTAYGKKKKNKEKYQLATVFFFFSLSEHRVLPTHRTKKGLGGENNLLLCNQGQP